MEFSIPIYNESYKKSGEKEPVFHCCALFFQSIYSDNANLRRASSRLLVRLRKHLNPLGRSWDQEQLAQLVFNPSLEGKRLKLSIELKSRRARVSMYFVIFELLDRHIAFAPKLPHLWFEVDNPTNLHTRALEVMHKHFRDSEKDPENFQPPEDFAISGETWISWVDLNVRTDPANVDEQKANLLALFDRSQMDGATELVRVGRCLDQLYPDDLQRAILRDEIVDDLQRLLQHRNRRPIMLVGPQLAGKSAIVHELVYRRVGAREKMNSPRANVWWLSPQRLITGMMYVGQWENRLLSILREANKQDHVLFFDDWLSMFRAGQSRDSNLSVADLIKNALQVRQVRLLGEMTPEQFHALAQRDRGFADLFHVVRVEATDADQTREIAMRSMQRLELENRCKFSFEVLSTATRLQQSYANLSAFPGKLIKFLKLTAIKHRGSEVISRDCIRQFQESTGLSFQLLDDSSKFSFEEVRRQMAELIIGQKKAVEVCARIVSVAKARLNETTRPLGSLLFVGPTGVGKTECAKALCKVMFKDSERLIRFDLNQFKTGYAASTLVGTADKPEGLLTSAVQQQPFSVVLLDEVEKAHPDVFDILLQVLGEGRLTDSLGRTTDFSNCVIIMTSNLGTKHAESGIGFQKDAPEHRFIRAVRQFFRPEFFNRIDDIVPFEKLKREQIAKIAGIMIRKVVKRQGLLQRQCILQIDPSAIDQVVEMGYHPTLGARAMKRALEEQFSQPVANTLATLPIDQVTLVRVFRNQEQLQVAVQGLQQIETTRRSFEFPDWEQAAESTREFLEEVSLSVLAERPAGELTASGMTPEILRYFAIDEQVNLVFEKVKQLEEQASQKPVPQVDGAQPPVRKTSGNRGYDLMVKPKNLMREIFAAKDIESYLQENELVRIDQPFSQQIQSIVDQAAWLKRMVASEPDDTAVLFARPIQPPELETKWKLFIGSLSHVCHAAGFEIEQEQFFNAPDGLIVFSISLSGPCVTAFVDEIVGSYLDVDADGRCLVTQVGCLDVGELEPKTVLEQIYRGELSSDDPGHPFYLKPVLQISRQGKTIDLRSGLLSNKRVTGEIWHQFLLRGLEIGE